MMIRPCPRCGRAPDIDECGPVPRGEKHLGWYAGCYQPGADEHFIGVNGDTRDEVIDNWNLEAARPARRARGA